jgi:hypothetical protein
LEHCGFTQSSNDPVSNCTNTGWAGLPILTGTC